MHFWLITTHTRDEIEKTDEYEPDCVFLTLKEAELFVKSLLDSDYWEYVEEAVIVGNRIQVRPDTPIENLWREYLINKVDFIDKRADIDRRERACTENVPGFLRINSHD